MRPYILAESNWKFIKNTKIEVAILPWGATEAHNYHLPYGTDIIEADKFSEEAARIAYENGSKVIVLPTIPFGVNTGQTDIKLDINIYPSTQMAILKDIIEGLNRHGIQKLLILNSHGGNNFKPLLRELGAKFPNMFLLFCNWYQSVKKSDFFEEDGDHADEMETSLMLYFNPDLVLPLNQAGDGKDKKLNIQAVQEGWAWTERKWSEVTEDTGIGNPKKSNAEKGEKYFNVVCKEVSQLIEELAQLDLEKKYS